MTYLASSGLCIGAIACLANQTTARLGNALGIMGVAGGIGATLGLINGDAALYGQVLGKLLPAFPCLPSLIVPVRLTMTESREMFAQY